MVLVKFPLDFYDRFFTTPAKTLAQQYGRTKIILFLWQFLCHCFSLDFIENLNNDIIAFKSFQ